MYSWFVIVVQKPLGQLPGQIRILCSACPALVWVDFLRDLHTSALVVTPGQVSSPVEKLLSRVQFIGREDDTLLPKSAGPLQSWMVISLQYMFLRLKLLRS